MNTDATHLFLSRTNEKQAVKLPSSYTVKAYYEMAIRQIKNSRAQPGHSQGTARTATLSVLKLINHKNAAVNLRKGS
jgi:hypothetical protein